MHATAFLKGRNQWISLRREPQNEYDHNAIMIIGHWENRFGWKKSAHIGYVPREDAALIATYPKSLLLELKVQLKNIWQPDDEKLKKINYFKVYFNILGPIKEINRNPDQRLALIEAEEEQKTRKQLINKTSLWLIGLSFLCTFMIPLNSLFYIGILGIIIGFTLLIYNETKSPS